MSQYKRDSEWPSLAAKIEFYLDKQPNGCWVWTRSKDIGGYGRVTWYGKGMPVHRAYLIDLGRNVPEGMTVDHLCRVRACANPDHLEVVTNRENILRGFGPPAVNARKTCCKNGHEFTNENTSIRPNGGRYCRACWRATWHKRHAERRSLSDG